MQSVYAKAIAPNELEGGIKDAVWWFAKPVTKCDHLLRGWCYSDLGCLWEKTFRGQFVIFNLERHVTIYAGLASPYRSQWQFSPTA